MRSSNKVERLRSSASTKPAVSIRRLEHHVHFVAQALPTQEIIVQTVWRGT